MQVLLQNQSAEFKVNIIEIDDPHVRFKVECESKNRNLETSIVALSPLWLLPVFAYLKDAK